jgi:tetratricopeptide (TPR) repeat protein
MGRSIWQRLIFFIFLAVLLSAGAALLWFHFSGNSFHQLDFVTLSEKLDVPLERFYTISGYLEMEIQNFLLLDQFITVPPVTYPVLTQIMGITLWIILLLFIVLLTTLKRNAFLLGAGISILLLTISGVNSLNIGGVGTNYALSICLLFLLAPAAIIRLFFDHLSLGLRTFVILVMGLIALAVLIYFAQAAYPTYLFSENIFLMALVMAGGFILYIGHSFLSGSYLALARLNRGIGIKIGWHFAIVSSLYLALTGLMFLEATGDWTRWPLPSFQLVLVLVGIVGYFDTRFKIKYYPQTYNEAWIGKSLYAGGFATCLLVLFKAEISGNTPMIDFLNHFFVYSQLGFGLLFLLYIYVNFSAIINSGNAIERIMYNPPYFPYFHMRLGGVMAVLILLVYAGGIIAVQFGTSSTQLSADYYYATNRPVEASVLYENAFDRYRLNDKALYAVSNIYLEQNQPTLALKTLERSFEVNPQVVDILLLSHMLARSSRSNEAVFYLEEGLKFYPGNAALANNLALLYHKMDLPEQALNSLERIEGRSKVSRLNASAIKIAHGFPLSDEELQAQGMKRKVNLLAAKNSGLNTASFTFNVEESDLTNDLEGRSLVRNYLSCADINQSVMAMQSRLDSMLLEENMSLSLEQNIKESDLIFKYKSGQINRLLAHLNGMAFRFSQDAGFYHSFAGWVLSSQGDFEKAAIQWKEASLKGYSNFTTAHLPFLYFGDMIEEAALIAATQKVAFPKWMRFDEGGELLDNDTVKLYRTLAKVSEMLGKDLLPAVDALERELNKGVLAREILLKKSHWLTKEEINQLLELTHKFEEATHQDFLLEEYLQKVGGESSQGFYKDSNTGFNPYQTPLVLAIVNQTGDNEKKYEMLREASQYNKDPILWITLVKYCRIIGLDQYASANLRHMSSWMSPDDLTELQLKFL